MSTSNIVLGNTVNNGGVILRAGTISSTQNYADIKSWNGNVSPSLPQFNVPTENSDVAKALSGSGLVFAYNRSRPVAKGVTIVLNTGHIDHDLDTYGTLDTLLITNINSRNSNTNRLDTTAMRNQGFNFSTGKFTVGFPEVSVDNFGNDNAASVSRSSPGNLCFILGKVPFTQSYSDKTG